MKKNRISALALAAVMSFGYAALPPEISPTAAVEAASVLPAPTGVKHSETSDSITLTWDDVSGADAYRIYMAENSDVSNNGKKTMIGNESYFVYKTVKTGNCRITGLKANTQYSFIIASLDTNGNSYIAGKKTGKLSVSTKAGNNKSKEKTAKKTSGISEQDEFFNKVVPWALTHDKPLKAKLVGNKIYKFTDCKYKFTTTAGDGNKVKMCEAMVSGYIFEMIPGTWSNNQDSYLYVLITSDKGNKDKQDIDNERPALGFYCMGKLEYYINGDYRDYIYIAHDDKTKNGQGGKAYDAILIAYNIWANTKFLSSKDNQYHYQHELKERKEMNPDLDSIFEVVEIDNTAFSKEVKDAVNERARKKAKSKKQD